MTGFCRLRRISKWLSRCPDTHKLALPNAAVGIDAVTVGAVDMAAGNSEVRTSVVVNSAAELRAAEKTPESICSAGTSRLQHCRSLTSLSSEV